MSKRLKRCAFGMAKGRSSYIIYALVLREHPTIVKLGRTTNWYRRSSEYVFWNFAQGDGILDLAVYCITEEYIDLCSMESACLNAMRGLGHRTHRGNEWFIATLDDAKAAIEDTLNTAQVSFTDWLGYPVLG